MIKLLDNDIKYNYKYDDVKKVLYANYTSQLASSLLGTWLKFSLVGEESARNEMSKATFYRHRKELIRLNCVWNNNIVEKANNNIVDFVPYSTSSYVFNRRENKIAELKLKKLYEIYKVS